MIFFQCNFILGFYDIYMCFVAAYAHWSCTEMGPVLFIWVKMSYALQEEMPLKAQLLSCKAC